MAAGVALEPDSPNPCCAEVKKKYLKLEEKRNALRQAVKLLEHQLEKLSSENASLKKAYDEERPRGELEREAKEKESNIRHELEKQIRDLKEEISSFQKNECSTRADDGDEGLLRILEGEKEIERLKKLLDEEKKRSGSEQKKAEAERRKAAEAWKLVKMEKNKAEEERRHAETERKKAEEFKLNLEKVKVEANELKEKFAAEISKTGDAYKKVEAEKKKTNKEKTHAASLRTKAEEQKRLLEVERKKAMDEKNRADNLLQKLEEEKQRSEELERKIEEFSSAARGRRGCTCFIDKGQNGGTSVKAAEVKILREQLKLKRKEVKHAKRTSKLEKAENRFIRRELHLLKQDLMQISCRFNMLYNHLPHSTDVTDGLGKVGESSEMCGCSMRNSLLGPKQCSYNSRRDFGLVQTCNMDSFKCSGSARECTCLECSRGSCTRPISGISLELDPPAGGSLRTKSQSSAVCYTPTSFSDRKFMGSQGKEASIAATAAKVAKKNSNQRLSTLKLSSKVAKRNRDENIGAVAENDRTYDQSNIKNACLNSSTLVAENLVYQLSNGGWKKRRIQDAMESISWLYSEDNQLHSKIGERLSELEDLLGIKSSLPVVCSGNCGISKHLDDGRGLHTQNHDYLNGESNKAGDKTQMDMCQAPDLQYISQDDIWKQTDDIEGSKSPCLLSDNVPASCLKDVSGMEEPFTCDGSNQVDLFSVEKIISGDYMKLLDLDNDDDERKFRAAINRPLSPGLPEIELPTFQQDVKDDSHYLVEEIERFETERNNPPPLHFLDVMDLEINSNTMELKACDSQKHRTQQECNLSTNTIPVVTGQDKTLTSTHATNIVFLNGSFEGIGEKLDGPAAIHTQSIHCEMLDSERSEFHGFDATRKDFNAGKGDQTNNLWVSECEDRTRAVEQTPLSPFWKIGYPSGGNDGLEIYRKCCAVFSSMNTDNITRIAQYIDSLFCQESIVSLAECLDPKVLFAKTLESELLPEEKASVLFSALLCNISGKLRAESKGAMSAGLLLSADFYTEEINRVLSEGETRSLFLRICPLDIFVSLIEDFLVSRKVVVLVDRFNEPIPFCFPSKTILCLNGRDLCVSSRAATVDQFAAACMILASTCARLDCISIVLEASYKILLRCKDDYSWILLALHTFATVCGDKFFGLGKNNLVVTAIRLVVSLLENRQKSVCFSSSCYSGDDAATFPPCKQCPFVIDTICMDKFIYSLLNELQEFAFIGIKHPDAKYAIASSVYSDTACSVRDERSSDCKGEQNSWNLDCYESCNLCKLMKLKADCPERYAEKNLCYFTDIISLVELVGCYMSWEWTYNKVVSRLLKMLDSCASDEILAALIVLLGQLGRCGICKGDHQQSEVAELRRILSNVLDSSITGKRSLPTQLAIVSALLNLLPFKFGEIVGHAKLSQGASEFGHTVQIKKWFAQLSTEHQTLAYDVFEDADKQENLSFLSTLSFN